MTEPMIAPADDYGRLFAAALPELPGTRHALARMARGELRALSPDRLPGPKSEAWKYTSVRPLAREAYALAPPAALARADLAPFLITEAKALRLVFVNAPPPRGCRTICLPCPMVPCKASPRPSTPAP